MKFHCTFRFIIIIFFFNLTQCRRQTDTIEEIVSIVFWHSFVASSLPALNNLIEDFHAEYPNIRIKAQYVPTGDALIQKLITAIQSGTTPDISWVHSDFLDKLVTADAIYPMDHFIKDPDGLSAEIMEDIYSHLLCSGSYKGTLYTLPMEATTLALLYNKDLFREAGLDPDMPPRTWDELVDFSVRLTVDKDGDGYFDQYGFYVPVFPASGALSIWMVLQWSPFVWQAGGTLVNEEQTKVLFNSESGIQALTLWKTLYQRLQLNRFSLAHDLGFASQSLAMVMDGPWNLPRYRRMKQMDWGVAPLPAGPVCQATYLAGEHLAVFKQSAHPREAWTFIKWILRPDIQARFSMESGYLPVRRSVLNLSDYQDYLNNHPHHRAFIEQMEIGRGRETIDYYRIEINQLIAEAVEKTIVGDMDPNFMLDVAARKANILLQSLDRQKMAR